MNSMSDILNLVNEAHTMRLRNPLRQPTKTLFGRMRRLFAEPRPRVFGLGLSRTGTKSLHQALCMLGYHSDHFSTQLIHLWDGELQLLTKRAAAFDALTDITAAHFFRELDLAFPGSKFVLTLRDPQAWLRSCERHFPPLTPGRWPSGVPKVLQLRRAVYGADCFDRTAFANAYDAHLTRVREYFAHRPQDLLELNITRGEGWEPICRFLQQPVPVQDFPWANRAAPKVSSR
jgi:hypothetical protein